MVYSQWDKFEKLLKTTKIQRAQRNYKIILLIPFFNNPTLKFKINPNLIPVSFKYVNN